MQDFIVENDKKIYLKGLHQFMTYDGLEGLPTQEMNEEILEETMDYVKNLTYIDEVYLIEPTQTPMEYDGEYPFGKPMVLPLVTCVARMRHLQAYRDDDKDYSALVVVWFQENYAFPIEEHILEKFKQIPWSEIAEEFYY